MKLKDIKPGMFVVCKEKPNFDKYYYRLSWIHDSIIGKKLKVIRVDSDTKTVNCNVLDNNLIFWFEPDWLSPWEEEPKGLIGYYQGIDCTGLDRDIVARMAEDNNDLCSSKIFNTIAKLNRCKQVSPKTAKLVDKLIKELVDILDLHEHEEKKDNRPLNNQIEILKEENEKLKRTIESLTGVTFLTEEEEKYFKEIHSIEFLDFLFDHMNPNEMEDYLSMYLSTRGPIDGESSCQPRMGLHEE